MTRTDQLERLAALTREMRAAQKAYFADRTQSRLNASKILERDVDKLLAAVDSPQVGLFGREAK